VDPTVEVHRDTPEESPRTRFDLPRGEADPARGEADPTREDLPRRSRGGDPPDVVPFDAAGPGYERPRRRSPWRWVLRTFYLIIALVVGVPLATGFCVWYVAREDVRTHSDAILVLGAAQYNGTPGDVLAWRLQHALNLYNEGVSKHILTVGGNQPGDHYTEAGSGKAWLNRHGVPESRLVSVPTGRDTLQSMIAAGDEFRKLGWHTAVIVTDPPHALRSRTMARANGIAAVTSPTRSGPTVHTRDTQFHYIVRETGGYLYFELIGRWRDEP
jgi:uncharacterized SAM-binding protein YcdF (DUF218 family)